MKKTTIKLIVTAIIMITVLCVANSNVFATQYNANQAYSAATGGSTGQTAGTSTIGGGSALNPSISLINPDTAGATGQNTQKIVNIVVGTIQIIGVAAAIIMLVFLAIKYVSAAPSEKADIKKGAVIYIVGAVFLFGASVILGFVRDFITQLGP